MPRAAVQSRGYKYEVVLGAHISAKDAQALGEWFEQISDSYSKPLTAELVYEAARDRSSPAHDYIFDRSQAEAAKEYYLIRARWLLRSINVIAVVRGEEVRFRAMETQPLPSQDGVERFAYEATVDILSLKHKRIQLMKEVREMAQALLNKCEKYEMLAKVRDLAARIVQAVEEIDPEE